MIPLQGAILNFFPLADLQKVRDLDYFDGPLLSHFRHRRGDHYLYYWCDCDEQANRWMMIRVSETNIIRLMNRFVPLDYVIPGQCQDDFVYFVDLDASGRSMGTTITPLALIPASYTPLRGAYLDYEGRKDERSYAVLIEKALTIDQLREFPTKYAQAYSFLYVLGVMKPDRFQEYPWRGGFSSMHFYQWLVGSIPGEQRPQVATFQYTSPGFVRFNLHRPTATAVANCVDRLVIPQSPAEQAFESLRNYISEKKLNDLREEAPNPDDERWREHDLELARRTTELMNSLDTGVLDTLMAAAQSKFGAARIAYTFGIRVRELAALVRQGLIKLPA